MKVWIATVQILRKIRGTGELKYCSDLTYVKPRFQDLSILIEKAMQVYERDMYETIVKYQCLDQNDVRLF